MKACFFQPWKQSAGQRSGHSGKSFIRRRETTPGSGQGDSSSARGLLLDEPSSALDDASAEAVVETLCLKARKKTGLS
jgi:hypothetical protein